jgi:hypothetical protein
VSKAFVLEPKKFVPVIKRRFESRRELMAYIKGLGEGYRLRMMQEQMVVGREGTD